MPDDSLHLEQAQAVAAALTASPITLTSDDADAPVIALGTAIGLLQEEGDNPGTYTLNPAWFADPIGMTGDGLASGGPALAALIADLIGQASGSSLGIPAQTPANLGSWYPILNSTDGSDPTPTGLYIVSTPAAQSGSVMGAGCLYQKKVSLADEGAGQAGPSEIDLNIWGLLPLLKMDSGVSVALGQSEGPITIGFQVTAGEGETLVATNGFSFTGVRLTCGLAFLPSVSVDVSLVVENLLLPTETTARDYTLADLEAIGGAELLALVASLALGALTRAVGELPATGYILPAVGLGPTVPGVDDVKLPILRWDQFVSLAVSGGDIALPIRNWFTAIANDAQLLQAWLAAAGGLISEATGQQPEVAGSGSRNDPFLVPLYASSGIGTLSMSVGSNVDASGLRHLYPGLAFKSSSPAISDSIRFNAVFSLELMDFLLTQGSGSASLTGNFSAGLELVGAEEGKPLFSGTLEGGTYVFGSLTGGICLAHAGNGISLLPNFALNEVTTPAGTYGTINLLDPAQLVTVAEEQLSAAIVTAFNQLFGPDVPGAGQSLAALLGVAAPVLPEGDTWPSELAPPFSPAAIAGTLQNPVAAYAGYWADVIANTDTISSQPPLYYMISALGTLLTEAGATTGSPSGTGTNTDPWLVALGPSGSVISLAAYVEKPTAAATRLTVGLSAGSSVALAESTELALLLDIGLLSLISEAGAIASPTPFPAISATAALPQGFTTPEVAGAALSVGPSSMLLSWGPAKGWTWSMAVGSPTLEVNGTSLPVGETMNYSNQQSLEELVTQGAATFAPILAGVLGIALYRAQARAGLALNGWFGLLPNLGQFMPEGITWPQSMPVLAPTGFNDPIGQVRSQLQAVLSKPDQAAAALQLLGWAIDGSAAQAAPIVGTGTRAAPYRLPLGLPGNFDATIWQPDDLTSVTVGLARQSSVTLGTVVLDVDVRLDAVAMDWASGAVTDTSGVPELSVSAFLSTVSGEPLTVVGGVDVNGVGFAVALSLGADGFEITPTPLLSVGTAATASPAGAAVVSTLVNAGFQAALPQLQTSASFTQVYNLLAAMGLMLPASGDKPAYGLDSDGWMALNGSGLSFLAARFAAILATPQGTADLIALVEAVVGIKAEPLPAALAAILTGLGLTVPGNGGVLPNPQGIVALAQNPGGVLVERFNALMADSDARSAVMAVLGAGFQSENVGPFVFSVRNGRTLTLELPGSTAISLGDFAKLVGSVALDVVSGNLTAALDAYVPEAGMGLGFTLTAPAGGEVAASVNLTWGDGSVPMPAPLQILPFDAQTFTQSLASLAPSYALSVFISRVVEAKLLPEYALARSLLQLFGLAEQAVGGNWVMKSTLGLFENPVEWLLSDAVIGADGTLNMAQIRSVLTTLPTGVAASGLSLTTTADGAVLSGLPFGLQVSVSADASGSGILSIIPGINGKVALLGGVSLDTLDLGLTLSAACQPGFTMAADLSAPISGLDKPLVVTTGYNKGFELAFGAGDMQLQLLPFAGWSTLVQEVAKQAAQYLLPQVTGYLLQALEQSGASALAAQLRSAGTALDVGTLLNQLVAAVPDPAKMEAAALSWLQGRVSSDNVASTINAVAGLFQPYVGGLTSNPGGLISYAPPGSVPITVLVGVRTVAGQDVLGLWVESSVTIGDFAAISLSPTGGGVTLSGGTLLPSFGFAVQAMIAGNEGPGLSAGLAGGFVLSVDPLMAGGTASSLEVEILPQPFGVPAGQMEQALESWLLQVAGIALPRYASALLLNTPVVKSWLDAPLFPSGSTVTAAEVLVATQLILDQNGSYVLNSLEALEAMGPAGFIGGLIQALTEKPLKIVPLPNDGGIWVQSDTEQNLYGLLAKVPDISLPGSSRFVFQLGASDTDWIALAGGDTTQPTGVALYLPIIDGQPNFADIQLKLVNIGVDFQGAGGEPLVNLSRFKLGAVKPRGLLTLDFSKDSPVTSYGGGFDLTGIQVPLAPNTATSGANVNPVAQNLLGSGAGSSDTANPAVNPSFSVEAGWLNTGKLGVQFLGGDQQPQAELWIPIQESFGPVHADKIGLGWDNDTTVGSVMFSGGLSMAGLSVELIDLSVSVNFANITDYSQYRLDLQGMSVSFNGGGVSIAGGLYKQNDPISYNGMLLVKFASFSLYAVGSFTLIPVSETDPNGEKVVSFFAFLNLNAPLGGDPAFFIEGLAGGFGVNRGLVLPGAGDITQFPLVAGAMTPGYFPEGATPGVALQKMGDWVPPSYGNYWIAAGFKFSNYKLLDSFLMLMVRFGKEFEIDIVGITQASMPPQLPMDKALAFVQMGLIASYKPDAGVVSLMAQLTPSSFVLSQSCKLSGGFAAIYWFGDNPNAGNFVVTLGGYNSAFTPPDYYPSVPRLGFNWPVIDESSMSVKISGGAYFALTPSMMMAGAAMDASFVAGPLSAWFKAAADFLIAWQPFYYRAGVSISVGAALSMEVLGVKMTVSAELGALLELWGPETAGKVEVDWYIVEFTIPFGNQDQDPASSKPLQWDQVVERMLPSASEPANTAERALSTARLKQDVEASTPVILTSQVVTGLMASQEDGQNTVSAKPLVLSVNTAIPATNITVNGVTTPFVGADIGVVPMELAQVGTDMVVALQVPQGAGWVDYPVDAAQITPTGAFAAMPAAVWSQQAFDPQGLPSADMVDNALVGLTLSVKADQEYDPVGPMDLLQAFGYDQAPILNLPFKQTPDFAAAAVLPQTDPFATLGRTVMSAPVVTERTAIWEAVVAHGLNAIPAPSLGILAEYADLIYVAPPTLAVLSVDVAPAPAKPVSSTQQAVASARVAKAEPAKAARAPRLLGAGTAYARQGGKGRLAALHHVSSHWVEAPFNGPSETLAVPVGEGCLSVLDLGSGQATLSLDAPAAVRIVEMDTFGRINGDRVVNAQGEVAVSDKTAHLAVIGGAAETGVSGWDLGTTILQAGLTTLLAPGCRIRMQASPRLRKNGAEKKRGMFHVLDGLARNRVQSGPDRVVNGWVETIFPSAPRVVVVVHSGALPKVRMNVYGSAGKVAEGQEATLLAQWTSDEGICSAFSAPAVPEGGELGVWLADWQGILSIRGLTAVVETAKATADAESTVRSGFVDARLPSFGRALPSAAAMMAGPQRAIAAVVPTLHINAA
ncbi:MAG: DUF6603 domain-containing protein [Bacteroidota bacterium]